MPDEGAGNQRSSGPVLVVDGNQELPSQVVPKYVYISKENVLQQALESLSLEIQETKSCSVGNDEIIAFVCINVPPHGKYSMLHQKKIFGDYKLTAEDALESAKLATLLYLQEIGIIFVDDINLSEVTKCEAKLAECQWKLLAASDWANMFQEETESLKAKLSNADKENEKLIAAAKNKLTPQGIEVKEEVSAAQTSSPPSFNHRQCTNVRLLQRKKRTTSHETDVKRTLFKTTPAVKCGSENISSEKKIT